MKNTADPTLAESWHWPVIQRLEAERKELLQLTFDLEREIVNHPFCSRCVELMKRIDDVRRRIK